MENEINLRYSKLTDVEREKFIKIDKRSFLTIDIVISSLFGSLSILFFVLMFIVENSEDKYLFLGFAIVMLAIALICLTCLTKAYKKTDEQRIKRQLKYQIQQELHKSKTSVFEDESIINVTLLDSFTEYSDKLHAFLNYQEIIQTRYYKFKVDYKDGSSKIVTVKDGSDEYINLIKRVELNKPVENKKSKKEELSELKEMLDEGLITQEEYEQKKKQILDI